MRWAMVIAGLAAVLGATRAQAAVIDGSCEPDAGPVAGIARTVEAAVLQAKGCLPLNDPRRPAEEEKELAQLEQTALDYARAKCLRYLCVSNELADVVDGVHWEWYTKYFFAGCGAWESAEEAELGKQSIRYWTVRYAQFKPDGAGEEHNVVQLQNTRTGERVFIDGWTAASHARLPLDPSIPAAMRMRALVATGAELRRKVGPQVLNGSCSNRHRETLCQPSACDGIDERGGE